MRSGSPRRCWSEFYPRSRCFRISLPEVNTRLKICVDFVMLATLRIKNLALVADLTLELQPGYNVITGETGAGKSILIGALSLVLGERADRTLIRSGADTCSVEAVFDTTKLKAPLAQFLDANGLEPCEEHQLVLKRAFTTAGANRQFINGSPTTLAVLAQLGEWLVDIHGPHEHQSLLAPAQQLEILDGFGGLQTQREQFCERAQQHAALRAEKAALIVDEKTYAQQVDLLRFQVHEIHAAQIVAGEDVEIESEHRRASNAARLLELTQSALETVSGAEASIAGQSALFGRTLQELERIDPAAKSIVQLHAQWLELLRDLEAALSHYAEKVEVDPARLRELEERIKLVAQRTTGFIYLVSVTGITGARRELPPDLADFVGRVRRHTDLPLAVGFGIGTGAQAAAVARLAEGVIVGSALVRAAGSAEGVAAVSKLGAELAAGAHATQPA